MFRKKPSNSYWGSVVYQIYPRSFKDSNSDGVGDLKGIRQKINYLEWLGVNTVWLSPFFKSPMADFGYDVADYLSIDPLFGSMEDFDELLQALHAKNIKLFIDYVPNHTSCEHAWFQESASSIDNPKRDWYVWKNPARDGGPPNNWRSVFGGSAWQFDPQTNQYYLHTFLKEQPDLNWHNPEVRQAMKNVLRFWLDKGVDGFRFDAVNWLAKDKLFRDDPINSEYVEGRDKPYDALHHTHSRGEHHLFTYLKELSRFVASYKDRFIITEAYPEHAFELTEYLQFYKDTNHRVLAPFNFAGIVLPWKAKAFREYIDNLQAALKPGYMPVYAFSNHDSSRIATRFSPSAAPTAAMLLLTLPGMPCVYYGDELGMEDTLIKPEHVKDPVEKSIPLLSQGRDPERTPMQWADVPFGGFSKVKPWLPTGDLSVNVEAQTHDPHSMLHLYRHLFIFRAHSPALQHGSYHSVELHPDIYCFIRKKSKERVAVLLNFSGKTLQLEDSSLQGKIVLSTYQDTHAHVRTQLTLRPHEGLIIEQ